MSLIKEEEFPFLPNFFTLTITYESETLALNSEKLLTLPVIAKFVAPRRSQLVCEPLWVLFW